MLQHLPTELLLKIIACSDVPTLLALRLVSRSFYAVIQTHERSIALVLPAHAFTSTTVKDFPAATHSKSGVADIDWLKKLERRESVLRELDMYVHRFSGGECDCDHPEGEERHARGLRKLWALSDVCTLFPPSFDRPSAVTLSSNRAESNPRITFLQSIPHAALIELWNTVEILMIELNTKYLSYFTRGPSSGANEPWCHIFERGPEWVLRVLKGEYTEDWSREAWGWSSIYSEVVRVYLEGEGRMLGENGF